MLKTVILSVDFKKPTAVEMKTDGFDDATCQAQTVGLARDLGGENVEYLGEHGSGKQERPVFNELGRNKQ